MTAGAPIHHSAEVGRPCSHGVKGQSSTIRKHKKENALNTKTRFVQNGLIIILQDVGQISTFVNYKLKGLYTKVAEEVYYLMKSKTLRESV